MKFAWLFYILICLFQQIEYSLSASGEKVNVGTGEENENAGIDETKNEMDDRDLILKYMHNYQGDDTPQGTAPQGITPQGTTPQGTTPQGTSPQGTSPQGTSPQGTTPQGTSPQGTSPQGTSPQGTSPQGTTPQGTTKQGQNKPKPTPTPNEYPLSKGQIKNGKSVKEMHQRLLFDINSHNRNPTNEEKNIYGSKWKKEKKEIFLTKLAESKEAVACNERAKKRRKIYQEKLFYSNDANNGIICKMLEQAKMSRGQLLYEAVEQAANIKSFGLNSFIGHADNTDLIELATTTTNTDREEMKKNWQYGSTVGNREKEYERKNFFTNLLNKQNVAENAAFSYILNYMMKSMADNENANPSYKRNEKFVDDGNFTLQDEEDFVNFLLDPHRKYANIGPMLATRNYVHLRYLFANLKYDDDDAIIINEYKNEALINEYKKEREKYCNSVVDGGKKICEMTPAKMKTVYAFVNLKFLIAKFNKNAKEQSIWKLLKAIVAEVELGRPYLFAELLQEKTDLLRRSNTFRGKFSIDYPDTFSDIIRIVLTRAGIDLADIDEAYRGISEYARNDENALTFSEALKNISEEYYSNQASDYGATLKICGEIVKWAVANDVIDESTHTTEEENEDDELPFMCNWPDCGKTFAQQSHLRKHEQLHGIPSQTNMDQFLQHHAGYVINEEAALQPSAPDRFVRMCRVRKCRSTKMSANKKFELKLKFIVFGTENTWNAADSGSKIILQDNEFLVRHSPPDIIFNSVRAVLPISRLDSMEKTSIIFYFEVEILNKLRAIYNNHPLIYIGFCDQQFPLEGQCLGCVENSIGIWEKGIIWIDGFENIFENVNRKYSEVGDVLGIGIIHSSAKPSIQCFATWNGELQGKMELPDKFANFQLFPAVTLLSANEAIRANFGKNEFRFDEFDKILQ